MGAGKCALRGDMTLMVDQLCDKEIRTAAGSAAATAPSLAGEHWWHWWPWGAAGAAFPTDKWLSGCES